MHGQFDSPITLPTDPTKQVDISGPLHDVDPKATKARVLFLVIQGDGDNAVTVEGEGTWLRGSEDTPWFGRVDRKGKRAAGGMATLEAGPARGIALAIALKDGELVGGHFIPPSIEALTWCVNIEFE
jgi:hypothetical protein